MRPVPPSVRALLVLIVVVAASQLGAWLLLLILSPNHASTSSTCCILAWAALKFGGPIVGLFLAISTFIRHTRKAVDPSISGHLPHIDRQVRSMLFIGFSFLLGLTMTGLGLVMLIPAAWGASGGDMPPGYFKPSELQVERTILYAVIGTGVIGLVLLLGSLAAGVRLLLTWERR